MSNRKRKYLNTTKFDKIQEELNKQPENWQEAQDKEIVEKFSPKPLNKKQERYLTAIETSVVTFTTGPAGTGRTYLACWMAVKLLREGKIQKIVLTRPLVDCGGEKMGFLPGSSLEKTTPYFHPMLDALEEFLGEREVKQLINEEKIILAPLAHMRGSSFKNSFILLDEAQNCNFTQLKMALSRIGKNCTMVISGDLQQTDLRPGESGFNKIITRLRKLPEIAFIEFDKEDIVRSGIVKAIIEVLE